jgi:hypothetical protein
MAFQGSQRQTGKRSATSYQFAQGGAPTPIPGTTGRDPRSTLGAYQYGVRTGQGTRQVLTGQPGSYRRLGGTMPTIRAEGGRRREWQSAMPSAEAMNRDYFNDATIQRFGGDESLSRRLVGLGRQMGGTVNAVDWAEQWTKDPFKAWRFNPDAYRRMKEMTASEQADALSTPPPSTLTVSQGFL